MAKNITLDAAHRAQIAEFLPTALKKSIGSYHKFMSQDIGVDADKFSKHHTAAKVAISHIELLFKLAGFAEIPNDEGEGMELAILLQQASAELDIYKESTREYE